MRLCFGLGARSSCVLVLLLHAISLHNKHMLKSPIFVTSFLVWFSSMSSAIEIVLLEVICRIGCFELSQGKIFLLIKTFVHDFTMNIFYPIKYFLIHSHSWKRIKDLVLF